MMKLISLNITANAPDDYDFVLVEIDEETARRLMKIHDNELRTLGKAFGTEFYGLTLWDASCRWGYLPEDVVEIDIDPGLWYRCPDKLQFKAERTDAATQVLTADGVHWTAYAHRADNPLETPALSWEAIQAIQRGVFQSSDCLDADGV